MVRHLIDIIAPVEVSLVVLATYLVEFAIASFAVLAEVEFCTFTCGMAEVITLLDGCDTRVQGQSPVWVEMRSAMLAGSNEFWCRLWC